MKLFKKMITFVLVAIMTVAMGATSVFAQGTDQTGTITIQNATKGETYKAYKLFDAHLGADGAISYTGEIPNALKDFFVKDATGNIKKAEGKTDEEIAAAVQDWGKTATGAAAEGTGNGGPLELTVPYGYYAVTSSQGAVVSVDSTNPNAVIYDKNTTTVTAEKTVDGTSYSIGDTITYTGTFETTNYLGEGENAKQVTKYEISDTLPEFLSDVHVTSIKVMGKDGTSELADVTTQFENKKVTVTWADKVAGSSPEAYTSKYPNGAKIVIVYTAKLTSVVNVNTANTNTITIQPYVYDGTEKPWNETWSKDEEIKTYAAALKKTDESGKALAGAKFTIKGLTVTGSAGEYTVVSYNPASTAAESTVLDTDDKGMLYIIGLKESVSLTVTEVKAPDGYNKLDTPISIAPQLLSTKLYKESGTIKYDAKGNVIASEAEAITTDVVEKNLTDLDADAVQVENQKGTELPSTGGIGTTIFYVLGGLLAVGAGIVLVARRKASE